MKTFGRNLVLAVVLASAFGAAAQATPTSTVATPQTQTGTDPVPPVPPIPPSPKTVASILLSWIGVIL